MNYIIHFCIFIVVLIVYLHIQSHFRYALEKEVFELYGIIDNRIDDVLNLKQPVVFQLGNNLNINEDMNIHALSRTYEDTNIWVVDSDNNVRVTSSISSFKKLQNAVTDKSYYSDGNNGLIEGLSIDIRQRIENQYVNLVPPLLCSTRYDVIFGSDKCITTLQRNVAHRSYFTVTNGTVVVKLIHPEQLTNTRFECIPGSVPDIWCSIAKSVPTGGTEMKDVSLHQGQTLFIPPYWGFIFHMTKDSFMLSVKYSTYMSEMATSLHTSKYWYNKLVSRSAVVPDIHVATNIYSSSENININNDILPNIENDKEKEKEETNEEISSEVEECINNDEQNDKK